MKPVTLIDDCKNFNASIPSRELMWMTNAELQWKHTKQKSIKANLVKHAGTMAKSLTENNQPFIASILNQFATRLANNYFREFGSYAH